MYVISVMPISRVFGRDTLTYFNKLDILVGSIVEVPIRKKKIYAIVLSSEKAQTLKQELKNLMFSLKKLSIKKSDVFINPLFLKTAKQASEYFATTEGSVIASIISKSLFELLIFSARKAEAKLVEPLKKFEETSLQAEDEERIDLYKGMIRESFAKKESVYICFPTESMTRNFHDLLNKGIEDYTILFTTQLAKKNLRANYEKIKETSHPLLIIGTIAYLPFIRSDVRTIVVEQEFSRFYKQNERPFLDLREILRIYAKHAGLRIMYSDTMLRAETVARVYSGEISEFHRLMLKRRKVLPSLLIDTKKKAENNTPFEVMSEELKEMIAYSDANNKSMFIFASRRGMSPQTVCRDCGSIVKCTRCDAPVVLHKKIDGSAFICHHCGEKRDAQETCRICASWRLEALGIGIERVIEELKKIGIKKIQRFDSDICKNASATKKVLENIYKAGGIVVGTEMALNHLKKRFFDYSAIVSFDSLFSLPDFRIEEKIMHLIFSVKDLARENFLLQGRNIDNKIVEMGVSGDLDSFMKYELDRRKQFGYPPNKILIKISVIEKKNKLEATVREISEKLKEYSPFIFPAFIKTFKDKMIVHMLIKLDPNKWPSDDLKIILMSFPPSVIVKIDPDSLL